MGILDRLPPGLAGYVAAEQQARTRDASNLGYAGGILGLQQQMRQQAFEDELKPLQVAQLRNTVEQAQANAKLRGLLMGQLGGAGAPAGSGAAPMAFAEGGMSLPGGGQANALTGQTVAPGAPSVPSTGMLGGVNPAAALMMLSGDAGLGKLGGAIQDTNKPIAAREGAPVINPATGQILFYAPKLEAGMSPQFQGGQVTGVSNIPGYVPAMAERTQSVESIKAGMDPFLGEMDAQGRPIPQTRGGFVNRVSPPAATALPGNRVQGPEPSGLTPEQQTAYRQVRAAEEAGQAASAIAPGGTGRAPGAGMGLTPGQRSAAETSGREEAQVISGYRQKIPALSTTMRRLDMLERLNTDDQTYAAAGSEFKTMLGSIAQSLGLEVAKDKTANSELYLAQIGELMKDRLASKDYGSGSGVSNIDLLAAKQPLPELAKTQQGRAAIIGAIRADTQSSIGDLSAATQHFDRNLSLSGFQYPSSQARANQPGQVDATVRTERPRPAAARPTGRVVKWNEL